MSLRHLVLLRFHEGTDAAQVDAITQNLRTLPGLIPEMGEYRVGPDLALADTTWDFGITADFASFDDYVAYQDNPDHQRIIHDFISPLVAERAAVQYDI